MQLRALVSIVLAACGAAAPAPPATPAPVVGEAATLVRCGTRDPGDEDFEPFVDVEGCLAHADDRAIAGRVLDVATIWLRGAGEDTWFTDDAELVFARAAAPSSHDVVLTLARARDRIRSELAGGPLEPGADDYSFGFAHVEIRRTGDEARLAGTFLELFGGGEDSSSRGVEADLRREDGTWRITRMREHPISWGIVDESETYDAAYWQARDREVAEARAALGAGPTAENRRALVERLLAAMRFTEAEEALAPLIAGAPNADDLRALGRVHGVFGRIEEAYAALERAADPATPVGTVATALRTEWCTRPRETPADADDPRDDPASHCDFEVLAELPVGAGAPRAVAVVRTLTGSEAAEAVHLFVHDAEGWDRRALVSEGPFLGNQTDGVARIAMTDAELADLDGAAPPELRMRFERARLDEGEETTDAGFVVCRLGRNERCAFLPDRIGASTYSVTFADGRVTVRRRRGPAHPDVTVGTRTLADVLGGD